MESTGEKGRIQVSQETADILIQAGRNLTQRDVKVEAEGKLQTYWLDVSNPSDEPTNIDDELSHRDSAILDAPDIRNEQISSLVDWNANNLVTLLHEVESKRRALKTVRTNPETLKLKAVQHKKALGEVREVIRLPCFDANAAKEAIDPSVATLKPEVEIEARAYVTLIAHLYHRNPFHNFEHASHVAMSVVKLLSRIVAPDGVEAKGDQNTALNLHDHTYGITSDPLTCFGCVFSAIIHDVDHSGIPNTELVLENPQLAETYKNQSVAEQNSVDVAWNLLMEDRFSNFRAAIFVNVEELTRFRQLVVNSVMATDIMDKQLKVLRNSRWEKAFDGKSLLGSDCHDDDIHRKATIVIEHLIQASDVSHIMQHWHIYRKWNEKLYNDMYQAFHDGRSDKDPTENWYEGEIGFFDFYIIPLARKLADCGVFGVSSFEYLNFAIGNREEWASRGKEIVQQMHDAAVANALPKTFVSQVVEV